MARPKKTRRRRTSLIIPHRRTLPGAPAGTIAVDPSAPKSVVTVMAFGPDDFVERQLDDVGTLKGLLVSHPVVWVNVDGLGDAAMLTALGEALGLHALAMEDVVNVHQRPKLEEYEDHVYLVLRMAPWGEAQTTEQLSVFLGNKWVVTFQEEAGDCFDPVRERVRRARGKLRHLSADHLAHALIDAAIDDYFPVLEKLSDELDTIEEEILQRPTRHVPERLLEKRHRLLGLKRALWPLRDALAVLTRDETALVGDEARVYLRDCADHVVQLLDMVESYREIVGSLMDVYLSSVSRTMNEIMKVLTVIATIFIPLTFIAGIYGMNFDPDRSPLNMPELRWAYGYPFSLGVMLATALGLLYYFRRKGWLGEQKASGGQE
ncbi:MAG: magnesium/cobalt transporter CorA [Polyangiaceae bacterium]|nr:magnesium/cobalt transporter CorA [Polyangiaceae bacterium]